MTQRMAYIIRVHVCLAIPLSVSLEITVLVLYVGTKYCRFPASPRTSVQEAGNPLEEEVWSSESNPDPNHERGTRAPNGTFHSTVGTSGLIVIPLLVRQDVKGRAERDFSSPFNRVSQPIEGVACVSRMLDRRRWTETDDGRINPAETGRRSGEG
jgi:hypothetical protein